MRENQEWQFLNRTFLVQVDHVRTKDGTVDVVCPEHPALKRDALEIPWALSLRQHSSAWQRMMPQRGDYMWMAFGPQNQPRLLGYASRPLRNQQIREGADARRGVVPYGDFIELQPGEFDMRSSGGAYIFGNRFGLLTLSGGPLDTFSLDKQRSEAALVTGMFDVHASTDSFIRLGPVKRLLPGTFQETDLSNFAAAVEPIGREYRLHLESPNMAIALAPGAPSFLAYDEEAGTVRSSLVVGDAIVSAQQRPLRHRRRVWGPFALGTDPTATPAFQSTVDDFGNVQLTQAVTATSLAVTGGNLTAMEMSMGSVAISAATEAAVAAPSIVLQTDPPNGIKLGSSSAALHPVVGEPFFAQMNILLASLQAQMTGLATALTSLSGIGLLAPASAQLVTAAGLSTTLATTTIPALTTLLSTAHPANTLLANKVAIE